MPENEFQELEQALLRAGQSVAYPPTPALAARVRAEIERGPVRPGFRLGRRAALLLAALVLALGLLLVWPASREALAQLLGLRTIRIVPASPTPTMTLPSTRVPGTQDLESTPTPFRTPTSPSTGLRDQCCATTLADAQARAHFHVLLPPSELPAQVYFQEPPLFGGVQQLILVFGNPTTPRIILYQATGFLYSKVVNAGTVIEETQVMGQRALWLSGAPHALVYLDPRGQPQLEYERIVSGNTLAWEMNGITFRLETPLSKEQALSFAESLR